MMVPPLRVLARQGHPMSRRPAGAALRPQGHGLRALQVLPSQGPLFVEDFGLEDKPKSFPLLEVQPTQLEFSQGSRIGNSPHQAGVEVKVRTTLHCYSTAPFPSFQVLSQFGQSLALLSGVTVCSLGGLGGSLVVVDTTKRRHSRAKTRSQNGWKENRGVEDSRDRVSESSQPGQR